MNEKYKITEINTLQLTELIKTIIPRLIAEDVLEELGIDLKDISHYGNNLRCYCPIHRDGFLKSLWIDLKFNRYYCEHTQCSGSRGGDFLDLFCKAKRYTVQEGVYFWARKMNLVADIDETINNQPTPKENISFKETCTELANNFKTRFEKQIYWSNQYQYSLSLILIRLPQETHDPAFHEPIYLYNWTFKTRDLLSQFVNSKTQIGFFWPDLFLIMIPLLKNEEIIPIARKMIHEILANNAYPKFDSHKIQYAIGYHDGMKNKDITADCFINEIKSRLIHYSEDPVSLPPASLNPVLAKS